MLPDLTIRQVKAEEFSVAAVIVNQGKANTSGAEVWAHLIAVDKTGKAMIFQGKNLGGMSPGQSREVVFDTKGRSLVGLSYWVKVDDANFVAESDESNNSTEVTEFRRKIKINPATATELPPPSILLVGKQTAADSKTIYRITVSNWDRYSALYVKPGGAEFPPNPCGATRLEAHIYVIKSNNGIPYQAGCKSLHSPHDLQNLEFNAAAVLSDVDQVEVRLVDRLENKRYVSEPYTVGWFGLSDVLVPAGCKHFLGRAGSYLCSTDQGFSACEKFRQQGKPIKCTRAGKQ